MNHIDALMHIVLGLVIYALGLALHYTFGMHVAFGVVAALAILLRELTQRQTRNFNDHFLKGWDFKNWGAQKRYETFVPMFAVITIGIINHMVSG